jgi:hypothetical protein
VSLDPQTTRILAEHRRRQAEERLRVGPAWLDTGLVFTDELGRAIRPMRAYVLFRELMWRNPLLPKTRLTRPPSHRCDAGARRRRAPQGRPRAPRPRQHSHHPRHVLPRRRGSSRGCCGEGPGSRLPRRATRGELAGRACLPLLVSPQSVLGDVHEAIWSLACLELASFDQPVDLGAVDAEPTGDLGHSQHTLSHDHKRTPRQSSGRSRRNFSMMIRAAASRRRARPRRGRGFPSRQRERTAPWLPRRGTVRSRREAALRPAPSEYYRRPADAVRTRMRPSAAVSVPFDRGHHPHNGNRAAYDRPATPIVVPLA